MFRLESFERWRSASLGFVPNRADRLVTQSIILEYWLPHGLECFLVLLLRISIKKPGACGRFLCGSSDGVIFIVETNRLLMGEMCELSARHLGYCEG